MFSFQLWNRDYPGCFYDLVLPPSLSPSLSPSLPCLHSLSFIVFLPPFLPLSTSREQRTVGGNSLGSTGATAMDTDPEVERISIVSKLVSLVLPPLQPEYVAQGCIVFLDSYQATQTWV